MADESNYSAELVKFVKQLATATGDLSQMTCPSFLLNGYSLLDYSLYWSDYPQYLYAIGESEGAEQMLFVVRWFLSTLYGSYHSRCAGNSSERKPFNPVLGENLHCYYTSTDKWTRCHTQVEQVSHHPPVSAFYVKVPSDKPLVTVQGHCGQRTVFSTGAIKVTQVGRARITVTPANGETVEYTIYPLPDLSVAGLLTGKIFVELLGKTKIKSSDGREAEVEFIPKGWFTGEYFHIKGWIRHEAETEYVISGNWTKQMFYTKEGQDESQILFDAATLPQERKYKPLEEQEELESHKLWGRVTSAINGSDFSTASQLKTEIEEAQRAVRKKRKEQGTVFTPKHFVFVVPADHDLDGTTAQDPQQGDQNVQGHWMIKQ